MVRAAKTLSEDCWCFVYHSAESQPSQLACGSNLPTPNPQPSEGGVPGACFKCGMDGHWARHCANQAHVAGSNHPPPQPMPSQQFAFSASRQPVRQPARPGLYCGGFTQVGAQTLYTAFSTGRTYNAAGPPPYPCVRCSKMHWRWEGCPQPNQQRGADLGAPTPFGSPSVSSAASMIPPNAGVSHPNQCG